MATHLRQLSVSGVSVLTGLVDSLHGRSADGWRIKVRGNLTIRGGDESSRMLWVRLNSQLAYDRAMAAHRSEQPVRAHGELSTAKGRIELIVDGEQFEILD